MCSLLLAGERSKRHRVLYSYITVTLFGGCIPHKPSLELIEAAAAAALQFTQDDKLPDHLFTWHFKLRRSQNPPTVIGILARKAAIM